MKRWLSTMTAFAVAVAMGSAATALAQAPKHGGVLNVMQREELPQGWGIDHFAQWPHVKNLVPHHSLYSYGRMQEVWPDR